MSCYIGCQWVGVPDFLPSWVGVPDFVTLDVNGWVSRISMNLRLVIFVLLLTSCNANSACDVRLASMGKSLQADLIKEFEKNNVKFNFYDKHTLCVSYLDAKMAAALLGGLVSKIIPRNRSISMGGKLQQKIKSRLSKEGIVYKEYFLDGVVYIVWEEKVDKIIRKIIKEETDIHIKEVFK